MTITYEQIATTTTSGSQTSVTFSSIPSTYTDLIVIISASVSSDNPVAIKLNNDTGSNYSATQVYASSGGASSYRETNQSTVNVMYLQSNPSTNILQINSYANSSTYKTIIARGGSNDLVRAGSFLWRSTSAISTIQFSVGGGAYFANGSVLTIFGLAAA